MDARIVSFVNGTAPADLDSKTVIDFLSYLAVERKVSKATQNQAFNAILLSGSGQINSLYSCDYHPKIR